jgi:adenosylcobinamide-phosphate synthase
MVVKMELIFIGYIMDLVLGDPYFIPHPIRFIGKCIGILEKRLRIIFKERSKEKIGGILLALGIIGSTYLMTYWILKLAGIFSLALVKMIAIFWIFQILAAKSLAVESRKVYYPLKEDNLSQARKFLSYIVGRDTQELNKDEITRATVETIAENISDGIIAPLFYIFIGGAPLGMAYKAINTLDSMVGYKNEKYINFGWASAKIDDLANYIPARITAFCIVIASFFLKMDFRNSFKILLRDRKNHSSPNAGYPEAAVAGALGVQLGGTNVYFGKPVVKPTIGDKKRDLEIEDINRTIKIMYVASFIGICIFGFIGYLLREFF